MATLTSRRERAAAWIERLHRETLGFVVELDGGGTFREDPWRRGGDGGGGLTCVLSEGRTFEKAGVNRSAVHGELPEGLARRLGARPSESGPRGFFVTGMSVVLHPRSPMVPTVHLNVRYFELLAGSEVADAWVGGGADLTPTYPFPEDAVHFHRVLRDLCARHHPSFYPRFKRWCDDYFVNRHRNGERRGVGGIFFDNLRAGDSGLDLDALLRFADEVGRVLPRAYGPIVARRRDLAFGERERRFQLARRGRYVEFNLVHDRGTLFGLETGARAESVLMSLPPLASWDYDPQYQPGSFEAELLRMLEPRDWAGAGAEAGAGDARVGR